MSQDRLTGYFIYLDRLHKLALTDMYACTAYFLESRFMLSSSEAEHILRAWHASQADREPGLAPFIGSVGVDVERQPRA
jgi:hypothetical protein